MSAEEDIRDVLQMATPVLLVFADENGPRPAKPYGTVGVRWAQRLNAVIGPLIDNGVDEFGSRAIWAHRDAIVEVHAYGVGAFETVDALNQALDTEKVLDECGLRNIAFFAVGQATRLPELRDAAAFEPHAILEISARYMGTLDESVGIIEHVEITVDTEGGLTEAPPITFTIDIPPA